MASLDSLPSDQRAVLALVLGRGRSYDEIARLLSINPESVRERALAALDALGPQIDPARLAEADRMMIGDYLLGQLPEVEVATVRERLAHSTDDRAWARMVSSELGPVASGPLPEIPLDAGAASPPPTATSAAARTPVPPLASAEPAPAPAPAAAPPGEPSPPADDTPRSSRRGGMVVIGLAVVVIVVLVLVLHTGSSNKPAHSAAATSTTPTTTASSTTSSASATARAVAQINLTPTAAGSRAAGIAEVLEQSSVRELAIVAEHVPPNTTHPNNAYAVWLYNSPSDAYRLGFVNPGVTSSGKLSTAGRLPANASRYKQVIITTETTSRPKAPGPILLRGQATGLS